MAKLTVQLNSLLIITETLEANTVLVYFNCNVTGATDADAEARI